MKILRSSLFQHIAFGFLIGTAIIGVSKGPVWLDAVVPAAHAAEIAR